MIICVKEMNYSRNAIVDMGSRWLGILFAAALAFIGWYCLLYELVGAAIFSVLAISVLLLSLFSPGMLAIPVKFCLSALERVYIGLLRTFLLFMFFLIITPMGLLISIFGSKFLSQEGIQRVRKYKHKSPGSYWDNSMEHLSG
jgi:hypothetical protein